MRLVVPGVSAALCMSLTPVPATAKIARSVFATITVGDLRLGMTRNAVETFMRAQDDMDQPVTENDSEFDCALLDPAKPSDVSAPQGELPITVGVYHFGTAKRGLYSVRFEQLASGPHVYNVLYTPKVPAGGWPRYLAEAKARYGEPDFVKKSLDGRDLSYVWCEDSGAACREGNNDIATLELTYAPGVRDGPFGGDDVSIAIDDVNAGYHLGEREIAVGRSGSPAGKRLLAQCRRRLALERDFDPQRREAEVVGDGMGNTPVIRDWRKVSTGVFTALGINAATQFAPGMCFQSGDVIIDDPDCKGYYGFAFDWARRVGTSWVMAMRTGGVSLERHFYVVGRLPSGRYRIVWRGPLSDLGAWLKAGAKPMSEAELRRR